jgi:hypothetical protein
MLETCSRTSCDRGPRSSCERNSQHFDRLCIRRRRPSFSESEDLRMRRSNSFSDGEERLSGTFCEGSGGVFERTHPSICKRHRLTNNSDWTNFYRWRSAQKSIMHALTPHSVSADVLSPALPHSPPRFSSTMSASANRRNAVRRDLELDCKNENEASCLTQLRPLDENSSKFDGSSDLRPSWRNQDYISRRGSKDQSTLRYGDVGLLLGLCPPPIPSSITPGLDLATDDDEDILPLLFKYTHVVGAN